MEMGNIISWGVKEGDEVTAGTVLAEIETDKATLAFENQDEGFIAKILAPAGSKDVKVGQLVAIIVEDAESIPAFASFSADGTSSSSAQQPPAAAAAAAAAAAPSQQQRVKANFRLGPAARKALAEAGLGPGDVNPTGPNNIITKADVLAAVAAGVKPSAGGAAAAAAPAAKPAAAAASAGAPKQQAPAAAKPPAAQPAAPPREGVAYEDIPNTQVCRRDCLWSLGVHV
jgi:pyruvate dehydrogenase E2 component (dihydrolipoamide acetyltransferase)